MIKMFRFPKLILFFLCVFLFVAKTKAQDLITSNKQGFYTYVYKISDQQAEHIYKKTLARIDASFFTNLIDSFPTGNVYSSKLEQGHYLKAFVKENKLIVSIASIHDFSAYILNNNTDLCIQIYDNSGNVITNADVQVRWKKLKYRDDLQAYVDRRSNQKGLVKVTYKGSTAYFKLDRRYNNSLIRRNGRMLLYGTPVKYVWIPVNYVLHLPVDGVKSIVNGWPTGSIYRTKRFFEKTFEKIACIFDDTYCIDHSDKFQNKHTGFIVFSKPKYKPADSLKFKAFISTKIGKPIDKPVNLVLVDGKRNVMLGELKPYRPGAFTHKIYLHDSLQLLLDKSYQLRLQKNEDKIYMSGSFRYEDYELSKNELSVRPESETHYKNQAFRIFIKATDENELSLKDARIELMGHPLDIHQFFGNKVFVPDTIFALEKKLNPVGETEIIISDKDFPAINFSYGIKVNLLTSDNELITKELSVDYFASSAKVEMEMDLDRIKFSYKKDGRPEKKKINVFARDDFGNRTELFIGNSPCKLELNPYYAAYIVETDSIKKEFKLKEKPSLVSCFTQRTKDSVFIHIENPRKLYFNYFIYRKNAPVASAYSDSLTFKEKTTSVQNYLLSLNYLWAGKVVTDNYNIPLREKKLVVTVDQPELIYPGQQSEINVFVNDIEGKPVENVDVTAFGLTKKFNYHPVQLPYFGKNKPVKRMINSFSFRKDYSLINSSHDLNYPLWRKKAGLDSIAFYRFSYPEDSIYRFEYESPDSITQFAPFVMKKGKQVPVHVVYLDNKPVYFSWSTNLRPYSFKADSGYHQIKLRIASKLITIDSMYFTEGKKLVFSLDEEAKHPKINIEKKSLSLTESEQSILYKYIFPYENNFENKYAFLENNAQFINLRPELTYQRTHFAGPISGALTFNAYDAEPIHFTHSPYFNYIFKDNLLKMQAFNRKYYPVYFYSYGKSKSVDEMVLTKKAFFEQWEEYLNAKKKRTAIYYNPSRTEKGNGKLLLQTVRENNEIDPALNLLLFRYDDDKFMRIYPGNVKRIHNLSPGNYQLILFYPKANYQLHDSLLVRANGLNYVEIDQSKPLKSDSFGLFISELIEERLFKPTYITGEKEKLIKKMYFQSNNQEEYIGIGKIIRGRIHDQEGLPLPGVSVMAEGTRYGTITNLDGYYSLKVPENQKYIVARFVGFEEDRIALEENLEINFSLVAASLALEEVVVMGFSSGMKRSVTGSVSLVNQNENNLIALSGQVAGLSISNANGTPGAGQEILIRGVSSLAEKNEVLVILDGKVFSGNIKGIDLKQFEGIEILKGENAVNLYGARAAGGVIILKSKKGTQLTMDELEKECQFGSDDLMGNYSKQNSIRTNFSDEAFWKPQLLTDRFGKATFTVTFPDDVTSWDIHYLAVNEKQQAGQSSKRIKSYKPIMAQLAVPRFLIEGDTAVVIGKALNYTSDSVLLKRTFEKEKTELFSKTQVCLHSFTDSLLLVEQDSFRLTYKVQKESGYFDGETREVPVFRKGFNKKDASFYALMSDTSLRASFDTTLGKVKLYFSSDELEVMQKEMSSLMKYKHFCNEQIASKLHALIAEKHLFEFQKKKYRKDREIEKLIKRLLKNKKEEGLWGWWKNSRQSNWISLHVIHALLSAEKIGFSSGLNKEEVTEMLLWELENETGNSEKVSLLQTINLLEVPIQFSVYIKELEKDSLLSLTDRLALLLLKRKLKFPVDMDFVQQYERKTLFGNVYYTDTTKRFDLHQNDIQNTLLVYKLLQLDSTVHVQKLTRMRNYFFEQRKQNSWRNTYESAKIIETIMPDLLGKKKNSAPSMHIHRGKDFWEIDEFPFEIAVESDDTIEIVKHGIDPVYVSASQSFWCEKPEPKKSEFEIETSFESDSAFLYAGKETLLEVHVRLKEDANYVLINVPIPGTCSYATKRFSSKYESHREYHKNQISIYCETLPRGKHVFKIGLLPRYVGNYIINPATIELMYFPSFNANNEIKRIEVK